MVNHWYGFNPPFFGGAQNVMSKQMDQRLIQNDVRQLLLTVPGERVNRPNFGTPIRTMPFELLQDPADLDILRNDIIAKIKQYEERVIVNHVLILSDAVDDHIMIVRVDLSMVDSPLTNFFVEVKLPNQGV